MMLLQSMQMQLLLIDCSSSDAAKCTFLLMFSCWEISLLFIDYLKSSESMH